MLTRPSFYSSQSFLIILFEDMCVIGKPSTSNQSQLTNFYKKNPKHKHSDFLVSLDFTTAGDGQVFPISSLG